jgi:hypothetical protein
MQPPFPPSGFVFEKRSSTSAHVNFLCTRQPSAPPPLILQDEFHGWIAAPQGFQPIKDAQDGYSFICPFGWQEVSVKGQDVVYKDVIEPLESVSVSLTPTDKKDITEYGSPIEVGL